MQEAERTQALLQSQLTSVKEQYETMFWETVDLEDMIAMDEREIEALFSSSSFSVCSLAAKVFRELLPQTLKQRLDQLQKAKVATDGLEAQLGELLQNVKVSMHSFRESQRIYVPSKMSNDTPYR
jgi:hypothetical protein